MKKFALAVIAASALAACQPQNQETNKTEDLNDSVQLETEDQQAAYALGASMGHFAAQRIDQLEPMGIVYDKETLVAGFMDSLKGAAKMDDDKIKEALMAADAAFKEKQKEMSAAVAQKNIEEGKAFLAENAKREGVKSTDSGLQYEVLVEGEGKQPTVDDTVKVHYRGTLLDGTEFDSSYARNEPAVFPLKRVIKGWTEGVQLMKEGGKFKFYIPSELAYGDRATGKITGNSTLVFEVELLDVVEPEAVE